jgi:hypothetical protein
MCSASCGNLAGNFRPVRFARVWAFIEFRSEQRTCVPQEKHGQRAALLENHTENWGIAPKQAAEKGDMPSF